MPSSSKAVMSGRSFFFVIIACVLMASASCSPRASANEKRYTLKGKVVSVDKAERAATIDHEDVVGYMRAMTMEFDVNDDAGFAKLEPGDQVTATLVVTDSADWLEGLIITKQPVPDPNAKAGEAPLEPQPGSEVPDFSLVNQDGKRIHLAQYRGQAVAVTFIYTRCPDPDQCTLMSTNFAAIDQASQKEPELYKKTHLLSISFDPDYDTPKVLRSYGAGHTGRLANETFQHWEFATGSKDEVKKVAEYFGFKYFPDKDSGEAKVIHSLRTAVIGPDGKLFKYYRGNAWKPDEILTDLRSVVLK